MLTLPTLHPAMKHAMAARKSLAVRTVFNILGPLCNPARVKRQVMGIFDGKLNKKIANVLKLLGSVHAMVVHGDDGLDEITLSQKTFICELKNKKITNYNFDPRDIGYDYIALDDIKGGDPKYNAECFIKMINGDYRRLKFFQTISKLPICRFYLD